MKFVACFNYLITISALVLLSSCGDNSEPQESVSTLAQNTTVENKQTDVQPLSIENAFIPCGWMGDGESGKKYVTFDPKSTEIPYAGKTSIKISYDPGPKGFAGVYWLNTDCNWGDEPGFNLSEKGYTKITFWGRGRHGGESAQFKAGGVARKEHKDSFNIEPKLYIEFETEWKEYTIDLSSQDLSNVIGGFCWVSNATGTIYLDELKYE